MIWNADPFTNEIVWFIGSTPSSLPYARIRFQQADLCTTNKPFVFKSFPGFALLWMSWFLFFLRNSRSPSVMHVFLPASSVKSTSEPFDFFHWSVGLRSMCMKYQSRQTKDEGTASYYERVSWLTVIDGQIGQRQSKFLSSNRSEIPFFFFVLFAKYTWTFMHILTRQADSDFRSILLKLVWDRNIQSRNFMIKSCKKS